MSEKMRVYQLAKELGVSSREVIWALGQLGVEVKNHMSTFSAEHVVGIKEQLRIPVENDQETVPDQQPEAKAEPKKDEQRTKAAPPQATASKTPEQPKKTEQKREAPRGGGRPQPKQKPAKKKREDRKHRRQRREKTRLSDLEQATESKDKIIIDGPIAVGNLAKKMGVKPSEAIKKLMEMGVMAGINQEIEPLVAVSLAEDMGHEVVEETSTPKDELLLQDEKTQEGVVDSRGPVVTVMGHVDHGKTSLLDTMRKTRVQSSEAGGITQHIGASSVQVDDQRIVFLDTPGHEAFTAMRARGARATDIAIIVVAADDGVMPQTVEAVNHAKAAGVPIVIAINKMDRPNANPDRIKQQLTELELVPEDWGGDTVCVPLSAQTGEGISELLEMLTLIAEMQELTARRTGRARGVIIESELDKGQGPVATVIVHEGKLATGDAFVAGSVHGRVRAMIDEQGNRIDHAQPPTPVKVLGFAGVPEAGDEFMVVRDDRTAREVSSHRQDRRKKQQMETSDRVRLEQLFSQFKEGKVHQLNIILKADVQGSVEAIVQSLEKLETNDLKLSVIHTGVGAISESDVMLAAASGAIIIGFNVRPDANARRVAESERVEIRTYQVIYDVIESISKALQGMLEPEEREVVIGRAQVRATFKVPKAGLVAGCYVTDGKLTRSATVRVVRDGVVVAESPINSLRRFKDDVREVAHGYECGIGLETFHDIKEGDVFEASIIEQVAR